MLMGSRPFCQEQKKIDSRLIKVQSHESQSLYSAHFYVAKCTTLILCQDLSLKTTQRSVLMQLRVWLRSDNPL